MQKLEDHIKAALLVNSFFSENFEDIIKEESDSSDE